MNTNSVARVLACFVCALFLFSGSAVAYDEKAPMVLKCGIDNPPGDMKAVMIKRLGDLVEQGTKGRIKFQYFFGGSLIAKPQFVDAVSKGIADISLGPGGFVSGKIPAMSIFEIYGAINFDKFLEIQKAIEPTMIKVFEPKDVRPIMVLYNPDTVLAHRTKFLKAPDDWKGQKMRVSGRFQSTLAAKWGASPVFMPPGELFLALQRGTIDGHQLIVDIINGLKLYEVTPYLTMPNFSNNIEFVTMNLKKWNAMTEADRAVFQRALDEIKVRMVQDFKKDLEALKTTMASKGAKIYYTTREEDRAYLKDAVALWPEVRKASGPLGNEFCDILEKFRQK
ncbi:MAG: TRAP transporter substrate-binding protein DctP [Deltaproteobacteria bacterium]|nr:TRAP transporter substrate-binding protein DctP [Deltaproteobacteria bacterium]